MCKTVLMAGDLGIFKEHTPLHVFDNWSCDDRKKVQVGKDQEKAPTPKTKMGKKTNQQSGTYTMKTFSKPNEQLFSQ